MPMRKLLRAALPFVAGGAVAIFVAELARGGTTLVKDEPFPDTWFDEAARPPEHLWAGEPTFDWGD
jgi:hypothetical protein